MAQFNVSKNQMDGLLAMAAKKMGKDPKKVKEQMESGNIQELLGALPAQKQAQIQQLLQNPEAVNQMMQNPKVRQLLQNLMGK